MKRKVEGEGKRGKFIRLAADRTNNVLQKIRVLGNCSNTAVYEYTAADTEKIFAAIEQQLKKTRERFSSPQKETEEKFSLQ